MAAIIERRNADRWPPAVAAADELMAICRDRGAIVDIALDADRIEHLQTFIGSMHKLAGTVIPPNRADRRRLAAQMARRSPTVRALTAAAASLKLN